MHKKEKKKKMSDYSLQIASVQTFSLHQFTRILGPVQQHSYYPLPAFLLQQHHHHLLLHSRLLHGHQNHNHLLHQHQHRLLHQHHLQFFWIVAVQTVLSLFLSGILSATSRTLVARGNGLPEQGNNVLEFVQPKNNINIKTNITFFSRVLSSLGLLSQLWRKMNSFPFSSSLQCWKKPQAVGQCWPWCAGCPSQTRAPTWMVKEKPWFAGSGCQSQNSSV